MKTWGPPGLSRSTTTVAAGRGFGSIGSGDITSLTSLTSNHRAQYQEMKRAAPGMDMNGMIAALLRDFAAIQTSKQSMWGYRRAAAAVLALDEPIESLVRPDGTLKKIPNIGPSSTRVILEVLQTGSSSIVERAIAESGAADDIERRGDLRGHFLSGAQVVAALADRKLNGPTLK